MVCAVVQSLNELLQFFFIASEQVDVIGIVIILLHNCHKVITKTVIRLLNDPTYLLCSLALRSPIWGFRESDTIVHGIAPQAFERGTFRPQGFWKMDSGIYPVKYPAFGFPN